MKLSQFKSHLENAIDINFVLQNGTKVPSHFHITEVGMTTKQFTDCGNTFRIVKTATFQLWTSTDFHHRLQPKKIVSILNGTQNMFAGEDLDIEIEYQQETIGKFGLTFNDNHFVLTNTQTDCLAKDNCGIPVEKEKVTCCSSDSSCC